MFTDKENTKDGLMENPFFRLFFIAVILILIVSVPKIVEHTIGCTTISTSYTITDKWIHQTSTYASIRYYFELNHNNTLEIQHHTWQQYEIGDTYTIEKRVLNIMIKQ